MDRRNFTSVCGLMLLFVLTGFGQHSALSAGGTEKVVTPLEPGRIVAREIRTGNKHFYKVKLEAGQFARIEADQRNCDVVFSMINSDGLNLLEFANVAESGGIEVANVAVETDGEFEFRVSAFHGPAEGGSYTLKIAEVRTATKAELSFTSGMRLTDDGFKLTRDNATTEELTRGIEKFTQAAANFRIANAAKREGVVLRNIGAVYGRFGNQRKSVEYAHLSLERVRAANWNYGEFKIWQDLGKSFLKAGEPEQALNYLAKATSMFAEIHNPSEESDTLNTIGKVYERAGDWHRAVSYYEQGLAIAIKDEEPNLEADGYTNLGRVYAEFSDDQKAQGYFQKALDLSRKIKKRGREAAVLINIARINQRSGEKDKALADLNDSLKIYATISDKSGEAGAYRHLGQFYLAASEPDKAIAAVTRAAGIYSEIEDEHNHAEALLIWARSENSKGNTVAAQSKTEDAINLIEKLRSRVRSVELRDSFSANLQDYYSFYIEVLMERQKREPNRNFAELALQAAERARARGLLNLLSESHAEIRQGVGAKLLEKETDLRNLLSVRLENLTKILGGKADAEQTARLKTEIERIRGEYEQVQGEIRSASPRYAALTQPQTLSLKRIQAEVLDADSILLEYALGESRSFLWIITKDGFHSAELPGTATIERTARDYYDSLTARNKQIKFETPVEREDRIARADNALEKVSAELSKMIIAPAVPFIANKRILVVADGPLQYIPFASLSVGNTNNQASAQKPRYLIETNEIVNLPSASVLAVLRTETAGRRPAAKTLAVIADPIFDKEDERFQTAAGKNKIIRQPELRIETVALTKARTRSADDPSSGNRFGLSRLPFTRREADMISSFVPEGQKAKWLDFAANRRSATSAQLSNYRFVHFATHGFINDENHELSGLVFSMIDENGKEQDGFLRVGDIYNLKLPAEMVVLSGCRTGLGKNIKGEGLVGMTRAFMYSGAKRVTVSLWDINDEATSELMSNFYRGMFGTKKRPPAAALRQAQNAMINDKRWSNPYFWATFVLQGEFN